MPLDGLSARLHHLFEIKPWEEVNDMALKKFGVGELTEVEKTDTAKTASKQDWTEDDQQALAQENDDEE